MGGKTAQLVWLDQLLQLQSPSSPSSFVARSSISKSLIYSVTLTTLLLLAARSRWVCCYYYYIVGWSVSKIHTKGEIWDWYHRIFVCVCECVECYSEAAAAAKSLGGEERRRRKLKSRRRCLHLTYILHKILGGGGEGRRRKGLYGFCISARAKQENANVTQLASWMTPPTMPPTKANQGRRGRPERRKISPLARNN